MLRVFPWYLLFFYKKELKLLFFGACIGTNPVCLNKAHVLFTCDLTVVRGFFVWGGTFSLFCSFVGFYGCSVSTVFMGSG